MGVYRVSGWIMLGAFCFNQLNRSLLNITKLRVRVDVNELCFTWLKGQLEAIHALDVDASVIFKM